MSVLVNRLGIGGVYNAHNSSRVGGEGESGLPRIGNAEEKAEVI
jgi:hypothetical protein